MWDEQYKRMLRTLERVERAYGVTYSRENPQGREIFEGRGNFSEIRDDAIHFFQDCFSLRDWVRNGSSLSTSDKDDIRLAFEAESPLRGLPTCRDLANGAKHLTLNSTFSVNSNLALGATGTAHIVASDPNFTLRFSVEEGGSNVPSDALELARLCVEEWKTILKNKGLLE